MLYKKHAYLIDHLVGVGGASLEIKTDEYSVLAEGSDLFFSGNMRLPTEVGAQIMALFQDALNSKPAAITLHLSDLEFLNSQGRNILAKMAIEARYHPEVRLVVRGSSGIAWQSRSLPNLMRLYPALELLMD